ncbi:MAG TPA: 3'-5' exonuclease [Ilumatobacter sp.]|nr:3'-5' exonuclease [Ilumatobacter sp.]
MDSLPRFAVVDVETSGLSTRRHRVLQVAVVTVEDGEIVDEWSSLVGLRWPLQRVGPRRIHGISRADLRHAPRQREVFTEFGRRLDGAVFTAHNVDFDFAFIERAARKSGAVFAPSAALCTLRMSRKLDPERQLSHRLVDVAARYGVVNDRPHDALFDARATALVLRHLLREYHVQSVADLEPLYRVQR